MSKVRRIVALALASAGVAAAPAIAAPAGSYAHACVAGADAPAMLVRVTGFKIRTGTVRVQLYGGDPDRYFEKRTYLRRIDLPVPGAGPLDVCVPASAPGTYAISVRHDVDGAGNLGRSDGGGMSGNPEMSLLDLMFKRKPAPEKVAVPVGHGVRVVPVTLNYIDGLSFRPVAVAER
ncbi:MAG TPA: DUF2141 domain-containing protein [Sphingomonas sp.]